MNGIGFIGLMSKIGSLMAAYLYIVAAETGFFDMV